MTEWTAGHRSISKGTTRYSRLPAHTLGEPSQLRDLGWAGHLWGEGEEVVVRAQMRSSDFRSRDSVQKDRLLAVCSGYAQLTGFNILQGKIWESFLEEAPRERAYRGPTSSSSQPSGLQEQTCLSGRPLPVFPKAQNAEQLALDLHSPQCRPSPNLNHLLNLACSYSCTLRGSWPLLLGEPLGQTLPRASWSSVLPRTQSHTSASFRT